MLNIDNWYNTPLEEIDGINWSFYAGEGYRGNLYSHEKAIGDFTADTLQEVTNIFPDIFEN